MRSPLYVKTTLLNANGGVSGYSLKRICRRADSNSRFAVLFGRSDSCGGVIRQIPFMENPGLPPAPQAKGGKSRLRVFQTINRNGAFAAAFHELWVKRSGCRSCRSSWLPEPKARKPGRSKASGLGMNARANTRFTPIWVRVTGGCGLVPWLGHWWCHLCRWPCPHNGLSRRASITCVLRGDAEDHAIADWVRNYKRHSGQTGHWVGNVTASVPFTMK